MSGINSNRKNTDQWAQPGDTVKLVALWLCICDPDQMHPSDPVATSWYPQTEANPLSPQLLNKAIHEQTPAKYYGVPFHRPEVLPPLPPVRTCLSAAPPPVNAHVPE